MRAHHKTAIGGFTLIEAMVALFILSILLGVGVPSFRSLVASQQVRNASFDLSSAMLYARAEATKRSANVTIAAVSNNWANGWQISAGGTVLQTQNALSDVAVASAYTSVVFNKNGRVANFVSGQPIRFGLTQAGGGSITRCLRIDSNGRVDPSDARDTSCS